MLGDRQPSAGPLVDVRGGASVIVGVPKEVKDSEYRVALTPEGARELTLAGHRVLIEDHAGDGSNIPQERYARSGAEILPTADEVWAESDLILKVKEPIPSEYECMREGQVLFTYLHLAASAELTRAMLERKIHGVAYETVQDAQGRLPLLAPMSEVAGRMAPPSAPDSRSGDPAAGGSCLVASRVFGRPRSWCSGRGWPA
jgi:alanine dehydrogenase